VKEFSPENAYVVEQAQGVKNPQGSNEAIVKGEMGDAGGIAGSNNEELPGIGRPNRATDGGRKERGEPQQKFLIGKEVIHDENKIGNRSFKCLDDHLLDERIGVCSRKNQVERTKHVACGNAHSAGECRIFCQKSWGAE
jgi:hypothetical protein